MQSSEWKDFQEALGKSVVQLEGNGWKCVLIERRTKPGNYWLAPYGPVLKDSKVLPEALLAIKQAAKENGISWVVVEPFGRNLSYRAGSLGLRKARKSYNPSYTVINDLSLDRATRFSALSPTYRNLINRAKGRGLNLRSSTNPAEITIFTDMINTVADRKAILLHNADYFRTQAEILMPKENAVLEIAYFENKPIASCFILWHGAVAHYAYAGSYPEFRKLEAGTVLLWQAMQNAKDRGVQWFDLFGVAPPDSSVLHPWQGFSTFKRKFGGEDIELGGTWELPINLPRYKTYKMTLPFIRKMQRL